MNDSDDYIPNAEVNTSNLSGMDKLSDKSESDAEEINDVLLKNLESDVFHMQNEVKQKEHEMQKLLADLQSKYYAEKDYEFSQIVDAYEQKIRELSERIQELDETAKQEREQKAKYFAVVATLENENERLRDENRRHLTEIFALNDRIQKMMHFNPNRSTANSSESMNAAITSPKGAQVNAKQKNDRNRQGFMLDFADDVSASEFDTAIIKSGDLGHHIDEAWINKFEFVKEKLLNEQSRNRELEFMIVTQKNIIENTNENMTKLKQENADLEKRIEKKRAEIDNLHQTRIIEKTKIDSVITFCELMENCVFPQAELVEKLSELPLMISSYLRGRSETIAFNKELSAHSKLVSSAKKIKVILDQVEEKVEKGENQYKAGLVASELDDIKHGITNLTQFLSKALPSTETPPRKTSDPQERKYSGEKSNYRDTMPMERMNYIKSSTLLAKAVQNSNSLLWNYKRAHPGSRGVSAER